MESYIFIRNNEFISIAGDYTTDTDIVENLGSTIEDYESGKYILLNKEQVEFSNEYPEATPTEVFNMSLNNQVSQYVIAGLIDAITRYDLSDNIKTVVINGNNTWYSKNDRVGLSYSLNVEKELGNSNTVLWVNNEPYNVAIDTVLSILKSIEEYAIQCNNVTQTKINEVKNFTTKTEASEYDITSGYPQILNFNI